MAKVAKPELGKRALLGLYRLMRLIRDSSRRMEHQCEVLTPRHAKHDGHERVHILVRNLEEVRGCLRFL